MRIRLDQLTLQNFMGIRDFTLSPQGQNLVVRGDNACGKTTLFSAFLWLLFGKDAAGRSDFEIKPLDAEGNPLHGLDHSVEATLDVDGKTLRLCKVFREKWTKKRGQTEKTLTGHTTEHFIDDVPVKKKEWEQKINQLIEEETFKLLTSPTYFANLHWQRRRQLLLEICGDVSDQEVIESNSDLSKLPEILGDRSLEDHRKAVQSRQKKINERLQEIPSRIDENQKSIADTENMSRDIVRKNLQQLEQKLEKMKSSGADPEVAKERETLEKELRELRKAWTDEKDKKLRQLRGEVRDLTDDHESEKERLRKNKKRREELEPEIEKKKNRIEEKRQEFYDLQKEDPESVEDDTCPTCGQYLPEDKLEEARDKARRDLANRKKDINKTGTRLNNELLEDQNEHYALGDKIQEIEEALPQKEQALRDKEAEYEALKNQEEDTDEGRRERKSQIQSRLDEIREIEDSTEAPDTSETEQQLEEERSKLSKIDAAEQTKQRIQELRDEEQSLAQEYEKLMQETFLMERFIRTKTNLLEERINSHFDLARFRLFEEQVDGALKEDCEITYNGVPYGHGLNRGAQANVGLDIIRALSKHYGAGAPVFVDNAETVSKLVNPGAQLIKLIVAPGVDQLQVETENQEEVANE